MLEYSRVFNIKPTYIFLDLGIRLFVVRLDRLKIKSIMLDNLWFWTSDKLTSMKRRLVTSLAINVARFTPVIENLHGHNFQSSWRICHSDWKLASDKSKLSDARLKLTELKKNPHASRGWFDCGGSRSSARVLRV